jgi:hypothetical protein
VAQKLTATKSPPDGHQHSKYPPNADAICITGDIVFNALRVGLSTAQISNHAAFKEMDLSVM